MPERTTSCVDCGTTLICPPVGRPPKRCETCRTAEKRAAGARERAARGYKQPTERPCVVCGEPFMAKLDRAIYCSDRCGATVWRTRYPRTQYDHVCEHCGETFRSRVRTQRFCSGRCSGVASAGELVHRQCVVCAVWFDTYGRDTCSPGCYWWRRNYGDRPLPTHCGLCSAPIVNPGKRGTAYCSRLCLRAVVEQRRRARVAGKPVELIIPTDIFERDNWICSICSQPIDPALRTGRWMATLDHVIPVSSPGYPGHIWDNLAAAHQRCNSSKGGVKMTTRLVMEVS